ncbi:organic hydroperoxide resistance protein [Viridibacillus sp. FSL R5-0477]|uniref:Organic hydroperoxide resistance protein n=1 Tax=Viridibacillus arenosi FSL R5-213 TaxID=1227360 RepID=W4F654_9BACL|nr:MULTISPECIES: organic hydroperoxide resistance protein [Viridibacillus]ETT87774.1 organic hydroperoxide resistance protein [Viridibacillus arenosi FSL R5-213]OMC81776.1 Organic hydroperoxide resistance protein OhrA [Viridibacillus sp. FSL H8-0123]OMC89060.1 Organic hydroperoxide resistance protein OhrA [Viridibacillus sp. FSL H7-0596]OMC89792.1 Organic hydroperoxide resistance protein OhrA [Viridibacillus arenosi]
MVVYFTSEATAKNGRDGHVKSNDGIIDLDLKMPKRNETPTGSNPEQLFAAAYSACYDGALNLVAKNENETIDSTVTAKVSLVKDEADNGFKIAVTLEVEVKGVSQDVAEQLTAKAHQTCPYSKATRGNVDVNIVTKAI